MALTYKKSRDNHLRKRWRLKDGNQGPKTNMNRGPATFPDEGESHLCSIAQRGTLVLLINFFHFPCLQILLLFYLWFRDFPTSKKRKRHMIGEMLVPRCESSFMTKVVFYFNTCTISTINTIIWWDDPFCCKKFFNIHVLILLHWQTLLME